MKIKFISLLLGLSLLNQAAFAESLCNTNGAGGEIAALLPYLMIMSITSAPTGTSILICQGAQDLALNLKESAINYKLTGEKNIFLEQSMQAAMNADSSLTEDLIVNKILSSEFKLQQ